jgi:hypothetical protein
MPPIVIDTETGTSHRGEKWLDARSRYCTGACNGSSDLPARLVQRVGDRCSGIGLLAGPIRVEPRTEPPPRVSTGPRVGVAYAGAWAMRPLALGSPVARTSPVTEPATGSAADEGTLCALEFGTIVEQLAGHTSYRRRGG